jgi:hypothetical protein
MQDLNVINKLNNEAIQRDIPVQQAAGKFVVGQFAGLNFVGYSVHDTEGERNQAAIDYTNGAPGNRTELFNPTQG